MKALRVWLRLSAAFALACAAARAAESPDMNGRLAAQLLAHKGLFSDFPVLTNPASPGAGLGALVEPRVISNAVAAPPSLTPPGSRTMESLDDKRKLGVGDRLTFRVLEDQEEAKLLTVTDAGELDVPELGLVPVLGKTCRQVAFEIKPKLEQTAYYHATVIVGVDRLNTGMSGRRVYVAGAVQRTGVQELPGGESLTVSKAIMRAGGFSTYAAKDNVKLSRAGAPGRPPAIHTVDVNKVLEKGRVDLDLNLEAEDLIYVPTVKFKIY